MHIDCATCPGRGHACDDCMVPAFFALERPRPVEERWGASPWDGGTPRSSRSGSGRSVGPVLVPDPEVLVPDGGPMPLDAEERRAVSVLVAAGLVDPDEVDDLVAWPADSPYAEAVG